MTEDQQATTAVFEHRAALTDARPVTRQMVHKDSPDQVMVSSLAATEQGTVVLGLDWSSTYGQSEPHQGTPYLRLLEAVRQATLVVAHEVRGIPLGYVLIAGEAHAEFHQHAALALASPVDLWLSHRYEPIERGVRHETQVWDGTTLLGRVSGVCHDFPPAAYERVRAAVRRDALDARSSSQTINIDGQLVVVDTAHRDFFDHASDHVPGMLLADDALRRAFGEVSMPQAPSWPLSDALRSPSLTSVDIAFDVFAELDAPLLTRTSTEGLPDGRGLLRFTFTQTGRTVAHGEAVLAPPATTEKWAAVWPS